MAQQTIRNQQANTVLGQRKILWIRGSNFGRGLAYTSTIADIQALQNAHRAHVTRNSYGKIYVQDYEITPVYDIKEKIPANSGGSGIRQLLDAAAVAGGYKLADYDIIAYHSKEEFGAGGLGSGNGKNGILIVADGLTWYHPGLVHEAYHAFGLGHAEHIEAGINIYPGVSYGGLDPYHHIGSDYDGNPALYLSQDLAAYHKYYLGWLAATNIIVIPKPTTATGSVHRIYRHNNLTSLAADRKVSLQISDKFWVSYEPTTTNPLIRKTGVLIHYIPVESPAITRLLDCTPDSRPGTTTAQMLDDLFDAALAVGEEVVIDGNILKAISSGGTGEETWVDIQVSSCAAIPGNDTDGDGVCNANDRCPTGDDRLDADLDGIPDACDTCPSDPNNDSNKNGICDNVECLALANESFEYPTNLAFTDAATGTGFKGKWQRVNAENGVLAIADKSLSYTGLETKGNSLRLAPTSTASPVVLRRDMTGSYKRGNVVWVSFLLKVNNQVTGSLYIKPNSSQGLAIGKKSGTEFGLDNNGTGIIAKNGQTYLLVAKYKIGTTNDEAFFWVNPDLRNFPSEAAANATKIAPTMGTINKVDIYLEANGGSGDYQIDELRMACSPPQYTGPIICTQVATAIETMTWNGSVSTDWANPCNWTPNGVPSATNPITIPTTANSPIIGKDANAASIKINAKLTINSGATLNINQAIDLQSGSINNDGTINIIGGGGISNINGSTITNNACGKIEVSSGNYVNGGTTTNTGLILSNSLNNTSGTFTNNGILKPGTLTGTVINNSNSSVIISNTPAPIFTYGGIFNGTIDGIFKDSTATNSAGTFIAPNTFTPSASLTGSQRLYAKITPSGGACVYIVPFVFNVPTGLTTITTQQKIYVYPNPAKDKIVIGGATSPHFSIFDMLGHEIRTGTILDKPIEIDISTLPIGIYLVKINSAIFKFIKQ
jgi:hypothetical protein